MLINLLLSYVSGLLTALAPCVLPLLPVILGGSFESKSSNGKRPYIITASLVVSLIVFTLLLKASTVLIGVDPRVWTIGSGALVVVLGVFMLFPDMWARFIAKSGIEHRSQGLLGKAFKTKNGTLSAILIGAALGPVFSSCSPTYAWVIATVLPANTVTGMMYLAVYCLGVATSLLAIALLGRKLLSRIQWASNPKGWFQRGIAVLFIIVGIFVATGLDKRVQTWLVDKDFLNLIYLEEKLVPSEESAETENKQLRSSSADKETFNVEPYVAPDFTGLDSWINSQPLELNDLRGKVVLADFWTYSCINCIRTQPYLNAWHQKYAEDGLVIVGVHAPEFAFEKVRENVARAVEDAGIAYPVALDNEFATWRAYQNRYWPAKYLIDKDGEVRYTHFGEGEYEQTETIIQSLLSETGTTVKEKLEKNVSSQAVSGQTPETYLGYARGERFYNASQFVADEVVEYSIAESLQEHQWSLGGSWQVNDESSQSNSDASSLAINFTAGKVYLVMSGPAGAEVGVVVEGLSSPGGKDVGSNGTVSIDTARLYELVNTDSLLENTKLVLSIPAGVTVNAFTFGG